MSEMWLFWFLTILIWSTVLFERPRGAQGWILFLVSVFFQGVGLVVINYTSAKQGRMTIALLQETHDTVMNELRDMKKMIEMERQIESDVVAEKEEFVKLERSLENKS